MNDKCSKCAGPIFYPDGINLTRGRVVHRHCIGAKVPISASLPNTTCGCAACTS